MENKKEIQMSASEADSIRKVVDILKTKELELSLLKTQALFIIEGCKQRHGVNEKETKLWGINLDKGCFLKQEKGEENVEHKTAE